MLIFISIISEYGIPEWSWQKWKWFQHSFSLCFLSQSQFVLAALIVSQLQHFIVIYRHWKKTTGLPMRETLNICTNIRIPHLQAYLVGLTYNILFAYSSMNMEKGKKTCEKRSIFFQSFPNEQAKSTLTSISSQFYMFTLFKILSSKYAIFLNLKLIP